MFYQKELYALKKSNRFRKRQLYNKDLVDLASNDYLGLSANKKILNKAYKKIKKEKYNSSKASIIINGYSNIHKEFENKLCQINKFKSGIVVGSGFLANISLIESLVRKKDILFIDEEYHASGILASQLTQGKVITFKHNDVLDLKQKLKDIYHTNCRIIIAIEGIYSMSADIASKEFNNIAKEYNAILIVDEAHSSGVIGKNLLGWFDYWNIKPKYNHIKLGTLGKAYGSYGAYILASKHIISYLENRAKPIIYSTAPSLFDIALANENLNYIIKNKNKISKKILKYQKIISKELSIDIKGLIVPINIKNNQKVIQLQKYLISKSFLVGAIRQPTVKQAILRVIIKLDIKPKQIFNFCNIIKNKV